MNRSSFIGTGVAMVTPFNQDGSIDFSSIQPLASLIPITLEQSFAIRSTVSTSILDAVRWGTLYKIIGSVDAFDSSQK